MTPSNPSNNQPLIYRIADSLGDLHLVTAFNHTHSQDEVSGLVSALAGKQATLTFDNDPTSGSNNPVKSGGIFTALAAKLQKLTTFTTGNFPKIKSDGTLEDSGKKPSDFAEASHEHNRIVNTNHTASVTAGNNAAGNVDIEAGTYIHIVIGNSQSYKVADITSGNIDNLIRALTNPDSTPTASSENLVTSGGVKEALDRKNFLSGQSVSLIINGNEVEIEQADIPNLLRALADPDSTPTANSDKLVTSAGVYAALLGKANSVHTHLPSEIYGLIPTYIDFSGAALDLDELVDDAWGMNKVIIKNDTGNDTTFAALFYSGTDLPVHLNGNGSTAIADGYYALCTIYKIDKDMNDSDNHEHDLCYFVTLDGIFDSGN